MENKKDIFWMSTFKLSCFFAHLLLIAELFSPFFHLSLKLFLGVRKAEKKTPEFWKEKKKRAKIGRIEIFF
jgi:hypothetical protein